MAGIRRPNPTRVLAESAARSKAQQKPKSEHDSWGNRLAGRCPACGWTTLFVAVGGHVTCSIAECPDPGAAADMLAGSSVYREVFDERRRAHAKHGETSMESFPPTDMNRLAILTEEIGEVAKEFNEARHLDVCVDLTALRKELIQVAAMAAAWADAIGRS